jgi:ABC-type transport system involved in multi-copper enzyme maturation permease subunit
MGVTNVGSIGLARDWCYRIIVLTQISMLLLVAPASTAGAFSTEIARGHVLLMLVTGMTPAEIVCGTLAARLLPVLFGVGCVFPVLVLASSFAGISLPDLLDVEIVTAGTAVLASTLALTLSIGARRLHETLMATYVLLLGWVLALPVLFMIGLTSVGPFMPLWLSRWSRDVNPYRILREPTSTAWPYAPHEPWVFLAVSIAIAVALASVASWRLRPSTMTGAQARSSRSSVAHMLRQWPLVSLDAYPVFWRECRLQQPSRWIGLLWRLYAIGAVFFTAVAVWECGVKGPRHTGWASLFNGFQNAVGLLLLAATVPAALAEDRARGSLEVLLSTPISTKQIVLSKWAAYYRMVPAIALLPTIVAMAHASAQNRWIGVVLVAALVLAQGTAVTSLGIALATWVRRVDRALILSAIVMVIVIVAWVPLWLVIFQANSVGLGMASASPLLGIGIITSSMAQANPAEWSLRVNWAVAWILIYGALGLGLLWAALNSFDRCVGRTGGRPVREAQRAIQSDQRLAVDHLLSFK